MNFVNLSIGTNFMDSSKNTEGIRAKNIKWLKTVLTKTLQRKKKNSESLATRAQLKH